MTCNGDIQRPYAAHDWVAVGSNTVCSVCDVLKEVVEVRDGRARGAERSGKVGIMKHAIIAYVVSVFGLIAGMYSISSMRSERAQHDALNAALATRLAKCEASNEEWDALVQKFAYDHSACEAKIDFNDAIKKLDTASKLQKQGKLPQPVKP